MVKAMASFIRWQEVGCGFATVSQEVADCVTGRTDGCVFVCACACVRGLPREDVLAGVRVDHGSEL